jgi:hypothetical protein
MHCANTGVGRWFGWPCLVSGGAFEDRDEAVAVDLDLDDLGLNDGFRWPGAVLERGQIAVDGGW